MTLDFTCPLFVPGNRPERFAKAASSGADAIILDLEDAVAPDEKDNARASLSKTFTQLPVIVRVNAIGTPWHDEDIAAIIALAPTAVLLPKSEAGFALNALAERLHAKSIPLIALIETGLGIASARSVAALNNIERLAFGSIDYCTDLGCAHTRDALSSARSELVLASRLATIIPPIDGVTTSIDELALIQADARYAAEIGFSGKLAIHPRQVAAIHAGFLPTPTEIAWAEKIAETAGGVGMVDGLMVDLPVRLRAAQILKRSQAQPTEFCKPQ